MAEPQGVQPPRRGIGDKTQEFGVEAGEWLGETGKGRFIRVNEKPSKNCPFCLFFFFLIRTLETTDAPHWRKRNLTRMKPCKINKTYPLGGCA